MSGFPAWSSGTDQYRGDQRRQRKLDQAHADLQVLPDLCAQLAPQLTEKPSAPIDGGGGGKVAGSPALVRLDVMHLVDTERKDGWKGADPRYVDVVARYGVAPALETWSRVVYEEMPSHELPDMAEHATVSSECTFLLATWDWIAEQEWAEELAVDVIRMGSQLRAALGERKPLRFICPQCGARAHLVAGGFLTCDEGHDTSVRDLEGQQRRRAAMTTSEAVAEFRITEAQLWQWKRRHKIRPLDSTQKPQRWLPWDIFCLLNPDIAEAIDTRDQSELHA